MKNKYKLLIPVLLMSFLLIGSVSAMTVEVTYVGLNPQSETEDIPSLTECCFGDMCKWVNYCDVGEGAIEPENYIVETTPMEIIVEEIIEEPIVEPTFDVIEPIPTIELTSGKGKQTFELGYDCYHQSGVYIINDCKQVEHKRSWFEKKDFRIWGGWCYRVNSDWICHYTWYRPAKV